MEEQNKGNSWSIEREEKKEIDKERKKYTIK
jgi:hypothetical protein